VDLRRVFAAAVAAGRVDHEGDDEGVAQRVLVPDLEEDRLPVPERPWRVDARTGNARGRRK
jgi:hypothetical protein